MNQKTSHGLKSASSIMPWLIWFLAVCFYAYEFVQRVSISVYLSHMMHDINASAAGIGLLSSCYYYAYAIMQLPAGVLVDKFGPKRLTLAGIFIVVIGSFFLGTIDSVVAGAGARFLIGMGSAFAFICTMQFIIIWFPANRFAVLAGLTNFMGYVGATLGEIPLSRLVHDYGWRHTVYITACIGIGLFILVAFFVKRHPLLHKKPRKHITPKRPQIFEGLKVITKNTSNWFNGLYCCLVVGPTSAFAALWGIKFLTSVDHISHQLAAGALSAIFIGVAVGSPIFGSVSDYFQRRQPLLIIAAIGGALCTLALIFFNHLNSAVLFSICFLFGFFQSGHVLCFANAKDSNTRHNSGTAISFINMALIIGGAILQPTIGILLDWLHHGASMHSIDSFSTATFHTAFLVIPLSQIIAFFIAMLFLSDPKTQHR